MDLGERAGVICHVILELKATDELHPRHTAQLLSYLKASGLQLGLLVNYGKERVQIIRKVNSIKPNDR
jgi:GxxExxY protein